MSILGQIKAPDYPPYPDNDKDRLDLIFKAYEKESLSMWINIAEITPSMGWYLEMNELLRLEKLLVKTKLFHKTPKGYYQAMQLTDDARYILGEFELYSKYRESLQPKESEEIKILKYLKARPNQIWHSAKEVFSSLEIDENEMSSVLASLNGLIDTKRFISTMDSDCLISIRNEGLAYLRNPSSAKSSITYEHNEYHAPTIRIEGVNNNVSQAITEKGDVNTTTVLNVEQNISYTTLKDEDEKKLKEYGVTDNEIGVLKTIIAENTSDKPSLIGKVMKWLGGVTASVAGRGLYDNIPAVTNYIHKLFL